MAVDQARPFAGDTNDEIVSMIGLIEENIAECGPRSDYTTRNRPVLRALRIEAERRGLTVP